MCNYWLLAFRTNIIVCVCHLYVILKWMGLHCWYEVLHAGSENNNWYSSYVSNLVSQMASQRKLHNYVPYVSTFGRSKPAYKCTTVLGDQLGNFSLACNWFSAILHNIELVQVRYNRWVKYAYSLCRVNNISERDPNWESNCIYGYVLPILYPSELQRLSIQLG